MSTAWAFLLIVVTVGTLVYQQIGEGRWSLLDCFYMAVITLSTVGYGEVLEGFAEVPGARAFTTVLIVLGSGTLLYSASMITAFVVEGDLLGVLRGNRMQSRIDQLTGHVIICGAGSTGIHILRELSAAKEPFVVIDQDQGRLERLLEDLEDPGLLYVVGDATDDNVLTQAGIARARGLIAALHSDIDNLFVTISARALSPQARIVVKATEHSAEPKLRRAGADTVVSPYEIGALRMVSEMVRPQVVKFLDEMLRVRGEDLQLEELSIPGTSTLVGAKLSDTAIREETDALVVALRDEEGHFVYNPSSAFVLREGMTLIVLAKGGDIERLQRGIADGSIGLRS